MILYMHVYKSTSVVDLLVSSPQSLFFAQPPSSLSQIFAAPFRHAGRLLHFFCGGVVGSNHVSLKYEVVPHLFGFSACFFSFFPLGKNGIPTFAPLRPQHFSNMCPNMLHLSLKKHIFQQFFICQPLCLMKFCCNFAIFLENGMCRHICQICQKQIFSLSFFKVFCYFSKFSF